MVFPFHNWLVLIGILEKVNKVTNTFSFCSKQTESSKCHNHMDTLTEQKYWCGIARAELPGNSSLRHWCLLLSTVATFFRPSMTANLFSLNLSSVFGSRLILPPGYGFRYAGQQNCVCGRRLDESWRLAMQPLFCRLPSRRCGLLYLA